MTRAPTSGGLSEVVRRRSGDIPMLVAEHAAATMLSDGMIGARQPLDAVEDALDRLAEGAALRQLLIPDLRP